MKNEIREVAMQLGADLLGVCSAQALEEAPPSHRLSDIMPEALSVIVLGLRFLRSQVDLVPVDEGERRNRQLSVFEEHNILVKTELDRIGYRLARFLEQRGVQAYHQHSMGGMDHARLVGLFSMKHAAQKAGIGAFGRSSLIITPQFGPRVRLTAVLTNCYLEPDEPFEEEFCSSCPELCVTACPAGALRSPPQGMTYCINRYACHQYSSINRGCPDCIKVCPVGRD